MSMVVAKILVAAEYEDLNGGCPTPANSSVRPAYIYPVDNTISDPWAYFKRTLTFQVHVLHQLRALNVAALLHTPFGNACCNAMRSCCCCMHYTLVVALSLL